jgi:uncharacterized protein YndB with AHSA1/START domain
MSEYSVVHSSFSIERTYKQPPAKVFAAFADPVKKRRWFVEGEGWEIHEYTIDFRVGGREGGSFQFKDGPVVSNDSLYTDIVPDHRIVVAYTMTVGGKRISSSLATTEFTADGKGTRLVYTEQAAFFDGADNVAQREGGCRELLEALEKELARGE